jgi:hypothetical protein
LIGAGLLINSFWRLQQLDRGFDARNVLTLNLTLSRYSGTQPQVAFLKEVLERAAQVPGVRAVGVTSTLPLRGGPATSFVLEDRPPVTLGEEPSADMGSSIRLHFTNERHSPGGAPVRGDRLVCCCEGDGNQRNMARRFWRMKTRSANGSR